MSTDEPLNLYLAKWQLPEQVKLDSVGRQVQSFHVQRFFSTFSAKAAKLALNLLPVLAQWKECKNAKEVSAKATESLPLPQNKF